MASESAVIHIPSTAASLPIDWQWVRLDEICDAVIDCPHSTPILSANGPFVVRSQDMRTGIFRKEEAGHVSEEIYRKRTARAEPRHGDLLYSREGTYFGIAAEVPPDVRVCLGQRMVLLRPKASKCNARFLRYWLNSPIMGSHIHGYRDGTVAERLNLPIILQLPVAVPPLDTQRAIAHILGTLDDKIELNRRMNETLEAMARALFKSWFVDFDPVRAKAEGRDPGLPKPLADLFPDSFEDSELGEIPKEWKVLPLADITMVITKGTTPTQSQINTASNERPHVQYVRVNAISEDGAMLFDKLNTIPQSVHLGVLKRSILQGNDVLYTIAGTIGRSLIVEESLVPANTNQAVAIIRPKPTIPPEFLLLTIRQGGFREELHRNIVHAVQANLSLGMLSKARVVLPPENTLRALFMPIGNLVKRINFTRAESHTLAVLRDTLLPKLISGELLVKNTERVIAGVGI